MIIFTIAKKKVFDDLVNKSFGDLGDLEQVFRSPGKSFSTLLTPPVMPEQTVKQEQTIFQLPEKNHHAFRIVVIRIF